MNPSEIQQLQEDIELERSILDAAFEMGPRPSQEVIDLRGPNALINVSATSSLGGQAIAGFVDRIMLPVLFGSAWKIIDLVIERSWQAVGGKARLSIEAKADHALTTWNNELGPLFAGDAGIAERLAHVYSATKELRHALTHRRLLRGDAGQIEAPTGEHLSRDEMNAFCRFSRSVARSLEEGFDARARSELAWWLNRLNRLHGRSNLSDAYAPRPIDIVLINAWNEDGEWFVDTERAYARARGINGGFPYADLHVCAPNSEFSSFEQPLEATPRGTRIRIDPTASSPWQGNGTSRGAQRDDDALDT